MLKCVNQALKLEMHEALRADLELSTYEYWRMWLLMSSMEPEDIISLDMYGEECSSRSDDSP